MAAFLAGNCESGAATCMLQRLSARLICLHGEKADMQVPGATILQEPGELAAIAGGTCEAKRPTTECKVPTASEPTGALKADDALRLGLATSLAGLNEDGQHTNIWKVRPGCGLVPDHTAVRSHSWVAPSLRCCRAVGSALGRIARQKKSILGLFSHS